MSVSTIDPHLLAAVLGGIADSSPDPVKPIPTRPEPAKPDPLWWMPPMGNPRIPQSM